jgi:hypothetical protein
MKKVKKTEYSPNWKKLTFVFGFLVVLMFFSLIFFDYDIFHNKKSNLNDIRLDNICERITATPTWANYKGEITSTGYNPYLFNTNDKMNVDKNMIVDKLISEKIYFVYDESCHFCLMQIDYFSYAWEKYKESGYTINCPIL